MRQTQTRALSLVAAAIVVALVGACASTSPGVSEEEVRDVARDAAGPVFYVGTNFADLPLTHIETYSEGHPVEISFIYGDCEPPADGGCPPPLEIQSAICSDGSAKVGIFGSPALRQRAADSLRPAGGGEAAAIPDVAFDRGPRCGL